MEIIPFNFDSHEVRVVTIDGEPYFVAKDVAVALGYVDTVSAIKRHCRGVAKHHPIQDSLGRGQDARVIAESDVMRLIVGSKLPAAEAFERLVFEDILPTIRKTGSYGTPPALNEDQIVQQAMQILTAKTAALESKVEEDAPKVEYVERFVAEDDDIVILRVAAQQLGIGEQALRKGLAAAGWIYKTSIGKEFSASAQRMVEKTEWRAYAEHANKFALLPQHNAPRYHNGQVRQTLYIKSFALSKVARKLGLEEIGVDGG